MVLAINGTRTTGQDVRSQNVQAALAIANIVKSSLGPTGLDKMLVDEVGDVTITNDGATILKQLEVEHPAGKVLVELSNLQDQEVGDGTTSVVILASELLKVANELVKKQIHPTPIISGFLLAKKEACKYIKSTLCSKVEDMGPDCILNAAKTSMSSKIIGSESEFFAKLAVDAVTAVKTKVGDKMRYPIKAVNILKAHGKSARESHLVDGFALNCVRAGQGMPKKLVDAKIALLDIDLRKARMAFGVQVLVTDPRKLKAIRDKEAEITKFRIQAIINAGANVVLTTQGIDDMAIKLFVQAGVMAVRRVKKSDLKKIARVTGGKLLISLANDEGGESYDKECLGHAKLVEETKVGDGELIYIKGCASTRAQTIVLRGANDYFLDEVERSLHDSMCMVKRTLESRAVVPGGGCVEAALSIHLEALAAKMDNRMACGVSEFAKALLIIPKTLAVNGAHDATELVAQLRAYHYRSQTDPSKAGEKSTGLDLENGVIRNNLKAGVLEPAMSKIKMLRFATEAAITILRIDDSIKMAKAVDPNNPQRDNY